jgi:hypothetical protein
MLGLILGRSCGLACVELRLPRFRLDAALDSDLRGTGPLGDGIAAVRGLGAMEALWGWSYAAGEGANNGVPLVEIDGVRMAVSMRLGFGRCCCGAAASGREISSMISSGKSDCASWAWPRN